MTENPELLVSPAKRARRPSFGIHFKTVVMLMYAPPRLGVKPEKRNGRPFA
jgi:hypothetical protein